MTLQTESTRIVWFMVALFSGIAGVLCLLWISSVSTEARGLRSDVDDQKAHVTGLERDVKYILRGIDDIKTSLNNKADAKARR